MSKDITNKQNNLQEIEHEINHYEPKKRIADAMRELGELGFEFSGHGWGFGGEDFGLIKHREKNQDNYIYVNFCDFGSKIKATLDDYKINKRYEGTVDQIMKRVRNIED